MGIRQRCGLGRRVSISRKRVASSEASPLRFSVPLCDTVSSVPSAAIGFRIKSGWANAVLLGGPPTAPHVLDRRRVELSDPADPALRQPYHAAMGVGLTDEVTLARRIEAVERYGRASCSRVIAEYRTMAGTLAGAALVVGSVADPEQ